jgi:uncharacterized protein YcnI
LLTLFPPATAWAHAEITPEGVPAGATEELNLEVLQEKDVPTTEVRMEVPEGFEVTDVPASGGWQGEIDGDAVVWTGGEAPQEGMGIDLAFEARAPEEGGEYAFSVLQGYEDGSVVEWTGEPGSEEPAAFVEVASSGGTGGAEGHDHEDAAQHGDEEEHGDERGSHHEAEEVPDTGGPSPAVLLAACALGLAASAATLSRTLRR